MKIWSLMTLMMLVTQSVFAMPCDSGYLCVSKSGKYKISLQRCRYRNNINLVSMKIGNSKITEATLNKGWDGENVLGFEINLPTSADGAVKILTAEVGNYHKHGLMKIKYAESEPGPLSVLHSEKISCKIEE